MVRHRLSTLAVLSSLSLLTAANVASAAPYAVRFNGTSQYVTFGAAPSLNARRLTVELLVQARRHGRDGADRHRRHRRDPADREGPRRRRRHEPRHELLPRHPPHRQLLVVDFEEAPAQGGTTPGLNHPIAGITPIRNDVWYHVAATFDGTRLRIYLNGRSRRTRCSVPVACRSPPASSTPSSRARSPRPAPRPASSRA